MTTLNIYEAQKDNDNNFVDYVDDLEKQRELLELLNKVNDRNLAIRDGKTPVPDTQMDNFDYFKFHEEFCNEMKRLTITKNADYTGNTGDPFANFRVVESLGITSTEIGFLTRMSDKLARISSIVQTGQTAVLDESVQDTLLDLANYAALFSGYLQSKGKTDV